MKIIKINNILQGLRPSVSNLRQYENLQPHFLCIWKRLFGLQATTPTPEQRRAGPSLCSCGLGVRMVFGKFVSLYVHPILGRFCTAVIWYIPATVAPYISTVWPSTAAAKSGARASCTYASKVW